MSSYEGVKQTIFKLVDHGSDQRYVVPAKAADQSTAWLLLADHKEELLTVYTDGFRAYDPLEESSHSHAILLVSNFTIKGLSSGRFEYFIFIVFETIISVPPVVFSMFILDVSCDDIKDGVPINMAARVIQSMTFDGDRTTLAKIEYVRGNQMDFKM